MLIRINSNNITWICQTKIYVGLFIFWLTDAKFITLVLFPSLWFFPGTFFTNSNNFNFKVLWYKEPSCKFWGGSIMIYVRSHESSACFVQPSYASSEGCESSNFPNFARGKLESKILQIEMEVENFVGFLMTLWHMVDVMIWQSPSTCSW